MLTRVWALVWLPFYFGPLSFPEGQILEGADNGLRCPVQPGYPRFEGWEAELRTAQAPAGTRPVPSFRVGTSFLLSNM